MFTFSYKGWYITDVFMSDSERPACIEGGVKALSPEGRTIRFTSVHAAKCYISRRS